MPDWPSAACWMALTSSLNPVTCCSHVHSPRGNSRTKASLPCSKQRRANVVTTAPAIMHHSVMQFMRRALSVTTHSAAATECSAHPVGSHLCEAAPASADRRKLFVTETKTCRQVWVLYELMRTGGKAMHRHDKKAELVQLWTRTTNMETSKAEMGCKWVESGKHRAQWRALHEKNGRGCVCEKIGGKCSLDNNARSGMKET
jgi:hypothetical protein